MKQTMILAFFLLLGPAKTAALPEQVSPLEPGPGTWQSLGPPGGNVVAVAGNPQNANEIYALAGETATQIMKSTDGGQTWTKISTILAQAFDLAISPTNQNMLYIQTSFGIYRSADRGLTWTYFSFGSDNYGSYGKIAVGWADGNTIYAGGYRSEGGATYMAVFKSIDGGNSWTTQKLSPGASTANVKGLAVFPANPNILYAAGSFHSGKSANKVYRTSDGGASWQDVSGTIYNQPNDIAIDPYNSSVVYVGTSGKVFRSRDGGVTWSLNTGYVYANALAIDPLDTNILFAAQKQIVYKSTDGGQTWTSSSNGLLGTGNDILISSSKSGLSPRGFGTGEVLFASTSGLFRSTDGGTKWNDISSGFKASHVLAIGLAGSSPYNLFVETGGNGFFKSARFGETWQKCASYDWCEGIQKILGNPDSANDLIIVTVVRGEW